MTSCASHVITIFPPPASFSKELVRKVKSEIRSQLSARHVPSIVLETKDIPVSVRVRVFAYLYVNSSKSLTWLD